MVSGAGVKSEQLVGRDAELRVLAERVAQAEAGAGALVVLAGEAGLGKSALATALGATAAARGFAVVHGRAWEFAQAPPWFPLWPALRSLGLEGDARAAGAGEEFALWERVLARLAETTHARPALWVVEDVHAADAQSLDLLLFLAQPLRAMRALVAVTLRPDDPRLAGPTQQRVARMQRDGARVDVGPLGADHVAALAARIRGAAVDRALAARLAERTGGNPLYVVECARALRDARPGCDALGAVPPTLVQVVRERVELLPQGARALLVAAATLGRDFTADTVARMVGRLPAAVIDGLLPALRAGLLLEESPGRFRFGHAVVRDALYDATPATERAALHARAARALEVRGDAPEVLLARAQHALAGITPETADAAVASADAAVERLVRAGAHDRAYALFRALLAARAPGAHAGRDARDDDDDGRDALRAATLAQAAGLAGDAQAHCERALAWARARGEPELFAQAALVLGATLRPGVVDGALVHALEESLSRLGEAAPAALRLRVRARLASAMQPALDPASPVAMARAAITEARAHGDDALLCDVLNDAGAALIDYVPLDEVSALAEELRACSLARGDLPRALRAGARLALAHAQRGDLVAVGYEVERDLAVARTLGHPRFVWRALLLSSMHALALGEFDESERALVEVQQSAGLIDDPALGLTVAGHVAFRAVLVQRDAEETRGAAERMGAALAGVPFATVLRAVFFAFVAARAGDADTAARHLAGASLEQPVFETDLTLGAMLAEPCALAGPLPLRRRLRTALARWSAEDVTTGHVFATYEGPVARHLGLLDASLGDLAGAEAWLREALARCRARALRPWIARVAFELAEVLARAGRDEEARTLFEEAAARGDALEMRDLAARARRALHRLSEALPAPTPPAAREVPPAATAPPAAAGFTLEAQGEAWWVTWRERRFAVRDSRGMRLLERLVHHPGEELHVLTLASDAGAALQDSDAGETLDPRALREYRARLADLEAQLASAEQGGDGASARALTREREFLSQELSRALGLGGATRRAGSTSERARVNVQRRLKDAIARISAADPDTGRYLEAAVRTGTFCSFRP